MKYSHGNKIHIKTFFNVQADCITLDSRENTSLHTSWCLKVWLALQIPVYEISKVIFFDKDI